MQTRSIKGLTRQIEPSRGIMQDEVDKLNGEAADLQNNARIENQHIRQMEGETQKKGSKKYTQ